jgi:3-phosphoshikimate 1-carboxyvinyltransferase
MEVVIVPGRIEGRVSANASKSAMQRAVAAALLARGKSIIYNPGKSNDCLAALDVAAKLGAAVSYTGDTIEIIGRGINPVTNEINCGESGLGIRMFTPIASLSRQPLTITGTGSLRSRPVHFFEQVLPQLNVQCSTHDGKPPLQIQGPLEPRDITVDGSLSSQFLTGLLMAYGAAAEEKVITVKNLKSKPYIDLTLQLLQHFGIEVQHDNFEKFYFGAKQHFKARDYTVEGDWSGAAFLLVAGAVAGQAEVDNLNIRSAQSDKAILQALEKAGAKVMQGMFTILIGKAPLKAFEFDATECPDLFPPLVALAANCDGVTKIRGVNRLVHKESDRGKTLREEFYKLGIRIELQDDEMLIYGGTGIHAAEVYSHHDHRIAMACATAALTANGPVKITNAEAVNKSYPEFWSHWQKLGGRVKAIAVTTGIAGDPGINGNQ